MGLDEFLAETKPEKVVDEGGFEPFKGFYLCKIEALTVKEPTQYVESEHYNLALRVVETLDGDQANNRTLRRNYLKEEGKKTKESKDQKIGNLLDDLFTWGIELPRTSLETFEGSFETLKDKLVHVRAYHFTPKDSSEKFQLWVAKAESDAAKVEKKESASPF